jgi:hypothetical protein
MFLQLRVYSACTRYPSEQKNKHQIYKAVIRSLQCGSLKAHGFVHLCPTHSNNASTPQLPLLTLLISVKAEKAEKALLIFQSRWTISNRSLHY